MPIPRSAVAAALLACSLTVSCAVTATPTTPSLVPRDSGSVTVRVQPVDRSLAELLPAGSQAAADGDLGVAVYLPTEGLLYSQRGADSFPLASVAKVLVLFGMLDRREQQGRGPSAAEVALARAMIVESDNEAATTLWLAAGGTPAIEALLRRHGLAGVVPDPEGHWGESEATPRDLALLLGGMLGGNYLGPDATGAARDWLTQVVPSQRFGAGEALDGAVPAGWRVAVKNGWLEEPDGWWVTSTATAIDREGQPQAVVVLLARRQPTFEAGRRVIDQLAQAVTRALAPGFRRAAG